MENSKEQIYIEDFSDSQSKAQIRLGYSLTGLIYSLLYMLSLVFVHTAFGLQNCKHALYIHILDFLFPRFNWSDGLASSTGESFSYSQISVNKSAFIKEVNSDIKDDYEIDPTPIGQGGFGKVYNARHKLSGEIRAVKRLSKKDIAMFERFKIEVMALKALDHPNIVKLFEVYYDERSVFLVMEM